MRPVTGTLPTAPPRKVSADATSQPNNGPMTSFFMASESEVDQRQENEADREEQEHNVTDSAYGVRSLDEGDEHEGAATMRPQRRQTAIKHFEDDHESLVENLWRQQTAGNLPRDRSVEAHQSKDASTDSVHQHLPTNLSSSSSPAREGSIRRLAVDTPSQPLAPISFASPFFGSSAPSSPKSVSMRSFRPSSDDEYEAGSQAIATSSEDDEGEPMSSAIIPSETTMSHQLIMPSITMPSRRPFTEQGKRMGRLKLLVAGAATTGKTSLIKSILQSCEDIVHVDSLPRQTPRVSAQRSTKHRVTNRITEIHASTKPYMQWWGGDDDNEKRRRRSSSSTEENLLERNLCFVDTPGFDQGTSMLEGMEPTLQFIESQFKKSLGGSMSDAELVALLAGNGGPHVDAVLYLINHDLKPADIEFIRQLNTLTSVIPLLAKADLLEDSSIADLKCSVVATLSAASVTPLQLPTISPDSEPPTPPYTVCSCPPNELEAMDASLLMKSEYIQPLHPSDLSYLVSSLFEPTNIAYLKHTSARKLMARRSSMARATQLPRPPSTSLLQSSSTSSHPIVGSTSTLTAGTCSALAATSPSSRLTTHQALEERRAQLRLASWAGSLQRSLANERRRYESLAKNERRSWLRERLNECEGIEIDSNALSGLSDSDLGKELAGKSASESMRRGVRRFAASDMDLADPLGLARLADDFGQQRSWLLLQIAGGCGVVGALAVWAIGRWGTGWTLWDWWSGEERMVRGCY